MLMPFNELSHLSNKELYNDKMMTRMDNEMNLRNPDFKFSEQFDRDRELVNL